MPGIHLLLWEVASSGHVDGAALPLIALALLFYVRHRPLATGFALGAATLVKLYPIALFPALYRRSGWRHWKMPAAVAGVIAAGYACYSSVHIHVLGFLPEYAKEEGLESGSRYFLLTLARHSLHWETLPTGVFYAIAAMLLLGLSLWAWLTERGRAADCDSLFLRFGGRPHAAVFLPLSLVLPVVIALFKRDSPYAHALFHHRLLLSLHHVAC